MNTASIRLVGAAAPLAGAAAAADAPRPHRRTGFGRAAFAALAVAALAACAGGPPEDEIGPPPGMETTSPAVESTPPTLRGKAPSGFVDMREVQIAYLGSAGGGKGTLSFQGQTYPFVIAGLGGGGIGVSTIDASGKVYNLTDLAQFPGAYGEGRYGAVIGDASTGDLWLENKCGRRHAPQGEARRFDAEPGRRRGRHQNEPMTVKRGAAAADPVPVPEMTRSRERRGESS